MTELSFGISVSTSAARGRDPVALAGHPGGGSLSNETPTMLTWIAARTTQIKVASNVLAVPFRRPAMVTKLATSPDRLSGISYPAAASSSARAPGTPTRRSRPSSQARHRAVASRYDELAARYEAAVPPAMPSKWL